MKILVYIGFITLAYDLLGQGEYLTTWIVPARDVNV